MQSVTDMEQVILDLYQRKWKLKHKFWIIAPNWVQSLCIRRLKAKKYKRLDLMRIFMVVVRIENLQAVLLVKFNGFYGKIKCSKRMIFCLRLQSLEVKLNLKLFQTNDASVNHILLVLCLLKKIKVGKLVQFKEYTNQIMQEFVIA